MLGSGRLGLDRLGLGRLGLGRLGLSRLRMVRLGLDRLRMGRLGVWDGYDWVRVGRDCDWFGPVNHGSG